MNKISEFQDGGGGRGEWIGERLAEVVLNSRVVTPMQEALPYITGLASDPASIEEEIGLETEPGEKGLNCSNPNFKALILPFPDSKNVCALRNGSVSLALRRHWNPRPMRRDIRSQMHLPH